MLAESYNHQQGEGGEILERLEAANIDTGDIICKYNHHSHGRVSTNHSIENPNPFII